MARALSSTLELTPLLRLLAQRTAQAVGAQRCSINLWRNGRLEPVMSQFADAHPDPALWRRFRSRGPRPPEDIPAYAEALARQRPVVVPDVQDPYWVAFGVRALLVVPMLRQGRVVGTLALDRAKPYAWTPAQVELATAIAQQAALAADNAQLHEQLQRQLHELRATQDQLLQAGKLTALGQLVAGVAHELNNPLAVIMGQAQLLRQRTGDPEAAARVDKIVEAGRRAAHIVRELGTFARPQPAVSLVRLPDVVERVLALRERTLTLRGIDLVREAAPDLPPIRADASQLEQVILNLLLNAEDAALRGTRKPTITLSVGRDPAGVRLVVTDSGPGIPAEVLPRIFEPFFTTKPVGEGSGLGLAIAYRIVEAHGGRIRADNSAEGGARFTVILPGALTT